MDVKCEKCSTEYEFDDAKVTEAGITVKCTNCGHLFRVVRHRVVFDEQPVVGGDSAAAPPPRPPLWMIRDGAGDVREFKDLATLQQWIVERKVSREDEISKTGENWKPLGSIIELSSFFLAVDASTPPPALRPPLTPTPGPAPAPPNSQRDLLDTGEFRLEGPGAAINDGPTLVDPPRRNRSGQIDRPPPPPTPPPSPMFSPPPMMMSQETPILFDGDRPHDRRGDGMARGVVMGVLATIAIAGVVYFVFDQLDKQSPPPPRPTRSAGVASHTDLVVKLERADVAYARDADASLRAAGSRYAEVVKALGDPPSDAKLGARAELGRARVALVQAEYAKLEAGKPTSLLNDVEMWLARSRELRPDDPNLQLAYADYYRVRGEDGMAAKYLAKAEAQKAPKPEISLMKAASGLHGRGYASNIARRLGKLPENARVLPRAQYLHAATLKRAGKEDQAIQALLALLAGNRDHGPASRLLQSLGASSKLAAPPEPKAKKPDATVAKLVPDAARPVAAVEPPTPTPVKPDPVTPVKPVPVKPDPKTPAKPKTPVATGGSYDSLMTRGYRLLERGNTRAARGLFETAVRKRPRHPEPWANLGWCDLDQSRIADAIEHFRGSLRRQPRYADGMYGLAVAYERANRKPDAIRAYSDYLKSHPRGSKSRMVQRKLDRLRGQ